MVHTKTLSIHIFFFLSSIMALQSASHSGEDASLSGGDGLRYESYSQGSYSYYSDQNGMNGEDEVRDRSDYLLREIEDLAAHGKKLLKRSRYQKAEKCFKSALDESLRLWGEIDHPKIASLYYNLGYVHMVQGKYEAAKAFSEEALRMSIELYGCTSENPIIRHVYYDLGYIRAREGTYSGACEWYGKLIALEKELGNRLSELLALAYYDLGCLSASQDDKFAMVLWYKKALHVLRERGDRASLVKSLEEELEWAQVSFEGKRRERLFYALEIGDVDLVRSLNRQGVDFDTPYKNGQTPLQKALAIADTSKAEQIIKVMVATDEDLIERVSVVTDASKVEQIITKVAINIDEDLLTKAYLKGNLLVLDLLLKHASRELRNFQVSGLLQRIINRGHRNTESTRQLINVLVKKYDHGDRLITDPDERGITPLHLVVLRGENPGLVEIFMREYGAQALQRRERDGSYPLFDACAKGQVMNVRAMLESLDSTGELILITPELVRELKNKAKERYHGGVVSRIDEFVAEKGL